jgi:hypothetical protein
MSVRGISIPFWPSLTRTASSGASLALLIGFGPKDGGTWRVCRGLGEVAFRHENWRCGRKRFSSIELSDGKVDRRGPQPRGSMERNKETPLQGQVGPDLKARRRQGGSIADRTREFRDPDLTLVAAPIR